MATLKVQRGISPEKFKAANIGLREDLLKVAVHANPSFENLMIRDMRVALDKFEKALEI